MIGFCVFYIPKHGSVIPCQMDSEVILYESMAQAQAAAIVDNDINKEFLKRSGARYEAGVYKENT